MTPTVPHRYYGARYAMKVGIWPFQGENCMIQDAEHGQVPYPSHQTEDRIRGRTIGGRCDFMVVLLGRDATGATDANRQARQQLRHYRQTNLMSAYIANLRSFRLQKSPPGTVVPVREGIAVQPPARVYAQRGVDLRRSCSCGDSNGANLRQLARQIVNSIY